ncbi:hypothetical protein JHK87_010332 [Glycine soja]|nr:hypothetical protein JHK87_010332 [Glycine soja]
MTFLSILKKLEGIDVAHFTKAVKALEDDPCWRDVFLAISDDQKKDIVSNAVGSIRNAICLIDLESYLL